MSKSPFDLSDADLKNLRTLVEMMKETELTEFEMERDDVKIRLRTEQPAPVAIQAPAIAAAPLPTADAATVTAAKAPEAPQNAVEAPLVGTFYSASSPDSDPFVKVGDTVKVGQTIGIVEAMKTMNHVESDRAGTVKKILVENAQPVEFGQPLIIVE